MDPLIIYSANGKEHIIMTIWSVRSLLKYNYNNIKVIVSNENEKNLIKKYLPDVDCQTVIADIKNYRMWAWRPFALSKIELPENCEIVVCDTDILWLKDPRIIFNRFKNQNWVHKITSLDPGEFFDYKTLNEIPKKRIGLRTMFAYMKRVGIKNYPNFHINCGLFMLSSHSFKIVLKNWIRTINCLPPNEMIMTEALLSIVYSELNLSPISDKLNIKHLNIKHRRINDNIVTFKTTNKDHEITGYDVAKHFYGDQRNQISKYVSELNLDINKLLKQYKYLIFKKYLLKFPIKILKIIKNV